MTFKIVIGSTFTIEPIEESINFWMSKFANHYEIEFAPYNQIFQQLLDPRSCFAKNQEGLNIILVNLEDFKGTATTGSINNIRNNILDLIGILKKNSANFASPFLLGVCPASPASYADPESREFFQEMEELLEAEIKEISQVKLFTSKELFDSYPCSKYFDEYTNKLAYIPYRDECYVAIGTMVARFASALNRASYKVIILDCDNTLWSGICGEDGIDGIKIGLHRKSLQEFVVNKQQAGMLVCLCSKNEEADVLEVFAKRSDNMFLSLNHIVAWRINWLPKSENIKSLASQLNLGLDSFIFIDDSPFECAEVKANCPEVLTLQLPQEEAKIPKFIQNVWAFDHSSILKEDLRRTEFYQQNTEREELRNVSLTLESFLEDLNLQVVVSNIKVDQIQRVSQLTQRTNQFNLTTIRRSPSEIARLPELGLECLVVEVSDRFGDYGLVGAIIFTIDNQLLSVDSLLLSCRALGRGVEHCMLVHLAKVAQSHEINHININYIPSAKNQPALSFLKSNFLEYQSSGEQGVNYKIPVEILINLSYKVSDEDIKHEYQNENNRNQDIVFIDKLDIFEQIANQSLEPKAVLNQIKNAKRQSRGDLKVSYSAPRNHIEEELANIWSLVFGLDRVGVLDNFFELGGDSLLLTQIVAKIHEKFLLVLPIQSFLEMPTIEAMAHKILENQNQTSNENLTQISLPTISADPENKYFSFPLTDIQQAYWLGRRGDFDLGNVATHTYWELDCVDLNLSQLTQAWNKLIVYHDMLRTIVLPSGQQQILYDVPYYQIEVSDLRSLYPSSAQEQLLSIREQMSHEILPEDIYPLFKIRATLLDRERTRLHFSFYALIIDAWSLMLLKQQLQQLYMDIESALPKLEISFRDYVLAELSLRKSPQYELSRKYWFNRALAGPPELPLAVPLSSVVQPRFKRYSSKLNYQQWKQLKQKAIESNLTPSTVLLTAFADILSRWSKSPEFTINLTLFNRIPLHSQVNQLVGDFASLNLLQVSTGQEKNFAARAKTLQRQLWQDLDHRYVSGVEVQRQSRRQQGNNQLMGVVFTSTLGLNQLNDEPNASRTLGEPVFTITQTPQVWLDHLIYEESGVLLFHWDVVEELYPAGLIEDMFTAYSSWLQQLAQTDTAWQQTQPDLLPSNQAQLIRSINSDSSLIPEETLHSLFQKQLAPCLQFPAVISPEVTLSYEQLNQLANNLAHQLRQLGAERNTLVAVIMNKGWQQVVATLGILMSGAAYLPISPEYPKERIYHLLQQGKVKIILTQSQLEQDLSLPEGIDCLSIELEKLKGEKSNQIKSINTPDDLAYVIYTSGSTGLPKGVATSHRGAVNTILDINERFGIQPHERVLALSALEFDLSVYDIFGMLAAGGAIVFPQDLECLRKDPAHWIELIKEHQVTIWNTVPAFMQMLVEYLSINTDSYLGPLRLALFSGDWIPPNLPGQVKSLYRDIQVVSLGGATEASIWSILYPIEEVAPDWKSIPYGKPMRNQSFYVLNQAMQITPTWVPGELYIGGVGLAKEYWQDEQKTNERFIVHPLSQERLYKTGDFGRYLPDGNIEFIGRIDDQVKISGFRVELGEIESALNSHAQVQQAVVIAREDLSKTKILVAYVVSLDETLDIDHLISFLKPKLPDYMIPYSIVFLENLPLNSNGKVDRKSLPKPNLTLAAPIENVLEPRNPLEQKIAEIWSQVLHLDKVGIDSNFFELGGHSLLATQLITRLSKTLDLNLGLRELFESPTIARLSQQIETIQWASQNSQVLAPDNLDNYETGEL